MDAREQVVTTDTDRIWQRDGELCRYTGRGLTDNGKTYAEYVIVDQSPRVGHRDMALLDGPAPCIVPLKEYARIQSMKRLFIEST